MKKLLLLMLLPFTAQATEVVVDCTGTVLEVTAGLASGPVAVSDTITCQYTYNNDAPLVEELPVGTNNESRQRNTLTDISITEDVNNWNWSDPNNYIRLDDFPTPQGTNYSVIGQVPATTVDIDTYEVVSGTFKFGPFVNDISLTAVPLTLPPFDVATGEASIIIAYSRPGQNDNDYIRIQLDTAAVVGAPPVIPDWFVVAASHDCNEASNGDGSSGNPFKNLYRAMADVAEQPGDIIQLSGGVYQNDFPNGGGSAECSMDIGQESWRTTVSLDNLAGTMGNDVIIQNALNETVIIDATDFGFSNRATTAIDSAPAGRWQACNNSNDEWKYDIDLFSAGGAVWRDPGGWSGNADPFFEGFPITSQATDGTECPNNLPDDGFIHDKGANSITVRLALGDSANNHIWMMGTESAGESGRSAIGVLTAGELHVTIRSNPADTCPRATCGIFVRAGRQTIMAGGGGDHYVTLEDLWGYSSGGMEYGALVSPRSGSFWTVRGTNPLCNTNRDGSLCNSEWKHSGSQTFQFYGAPSTATPFGCGSGVQCQLEGNVVEYVYAHHGGRFNTMVSTTGPQSGRVQSNMRASQSNLAHMFMLYACKNCRFTGNIGHTTYRDIFRVSGRTFSCSDGEAQCSSSGSIIEENIGWDAGHWVTGGDGGSTADIDDCTNDAGVIQINLNNSIVADNISIRNNYLLADRETACNGGSPPVGIKLQQGHANSTLNNLKITNNTAEDIDGACLDTRQLSVPQAQQNAIVLTGNSFAACSTNSTVANCQNSSPCAWDAGATADLPTNHNNNNWWRGTALATVQAIKGDSISWNFDQIVGNFEASALLVDPETTDAGRLLGTSGLIDGILCANAPALDIDGDARTGTDCDIGADEF